MIRPGGPGDLPQLRDLKRRYELERAEVGGTAEPATSPVWASWIARRLSAGDVRVGLHGGTLAGYIVWSVRRAQTGPCRVLRVAELYVAPESRGRHLGAGLVARALDRARSEDLAGLEVEPDLYDAASRTLLDRFGFRVAPDGLLVRPLAAG